LRKGFAASSAFPFLLFKQSHYDIMSIFQQLVNAVPVIPLHEVIIDVFSTLEKMKQAMPNRNLEGIEFATLFREDYR